MSERISKLVRAAACLGAAAALLCGQEPRGEISGLVKDPGGMAVPGATATARNVATNVAIPATANAAGSFTIPYLLPGEYTVTVEAQGFKRYERRGIELRAADRIRIDVSLEIGQVSESVTITGETPLLETATASIGQVTNQRSILELPLSGGNAFTLTRMAPGVNNYAQVNHNSFAAAPQVMSRISVSGARSQNTEFTVDGTPAMNGNNAMYIPPADMVQELRVETNSYDASVGRSIGGHVNLALRSGTNTLHGTLYEFHHNDNLRGLEFFQRRFLYNPATGPVNDEKKKSVNGHTVVNRFGGTVGGPVYVPGVYDGRNRTFFIYGFEAILRPTIASGNYFQTVPDAAQRRGDLSGLLRLGPTYQVYDPATITPEAGGRFRRQPFAGNVIPASRLNPMSQRFLNYWPEPNVAGTADGRNNYFRVYGVYDDFTSNTVRVDHNFSERHRVFVRYFKTQYLFDTNQYFPNESTGEQWDRPDRGAAFDDVYTVSPTFLINFRYGVSRHVQRWRPFAQGFDLAGAGFSPSLVSQIDPQGVTFPQIDIDQYASIGTSAPRGEFTTYHTFTLQLTNTRGAHNLRYGAEHRIYLDNNVNYTFETPNLSFGTTWTRGPLDNAPVAPIGQGLASYLLGIPSSGQIRVNGSFAEQSRFTAFYFQDDWRLTPKLTVNLGLRYEYDGPTSERYNRSVRGFDLATASPIEAQARANYARAPIPEIPADQFRVRGGLTFAGAGGLPRTLWLADRNNFAPRAGLAYTISQRTVFRAGWGLYYVPLGVDRTTVNQTGFTQNTAMVPSTDNGQTFIATFANPFPNGFSRPRGADGGLMTNAGQAVTAFRETLPNGIMHRWSAGFQHELPQRVVADVSYVASRATSLPVSQPVNGVPLQYLSTLPTRDQPAINRLTAQVSNPFFPLLPGTGLAAQTVARQQLLRPYPQFTGVSQTATEGASWYHSLQSRFERRFQNGFTVQGSYTWSKFMEAMDYLNEADARPARVIADQDRPHRFAMSGVYELPFGPKKPLGGNLKGAAGQLAGGWQIQAIYEGQSGAPLGFGNFILYGDLHDIPLPRGERKIDRWFNTAAGFERGAQNQLANNVRTASLRFTGVRTQGINIWNASGIKNFQVRERLRFQFRAEFLNAFNHTHFASPNTTVTNTLFGSITAASGKSREIYFALKALF